MDIKQRRQLELESYRQFKQDNNKSDIWYLIDGKWMQKWIDFLNGSKYSLDYIHNEEIFQAIFQDNRANSLKMNQDFILIPKNLFEYLYGIYGCDYFISAKQFNKNVSNMNVENQQKNKRTPSAQNSSKAKDILINDTNSNHSQENKIGESLLLNLILGGHINNNLGKQENRNDLFLQQRIERQQRQQVQINQMSHNSYNIIGKIIKVSEEVPFESFFNFW